MSDSRVDQETMAAEAARWISRRDAGLTPEDQIAFERWCAADPAHARALARYSRAWSVLDRPRQASAVLRELRKRSQRRQHLVTSCAFGATLILATFLWQRSRPLPVDVIAVAEPGGTLVSPERQTLPDGTIVELKSGAEIRVSYEPGLRRVVLVQGEAHFQVAKNEAWPFAVEAGAVQVRAVGTAFSVQRDPAQVEVVVTEGKIAVEKPHAGAAADPTPSVAASAADAPPQPLALANAGQRVVIPARAEVEPASVVAVSADEIAERLAWRAPRVEFSGTPLAEAVAMMNRAASQRGVTLVLDASSAGLAREPISGMFRADNAETFVRMLELSLGVQAERRGGQIVLKKNG